MHPLDSGARPTPPAPPVRLLLAEIGRDREFLRFLIVIALVGIAVYTEYFFVTYGLERFALEPSWAGFFTSVYIGSGMAAGLLGMLGDRAGHRVLLAISLGCHAAAVVVALLAPSVGLLCVAIGLSGVAFSSGNIAGFNLAMDFAPDDRKGSYSGAVWFVTLLLATATTPVAGVLVDRLSYAAVFAAVLVAAGLLIMRGFSEPVSHAPSAAENGSSKSTFSFPTPGVAFARDPDAPFPAGGEPWRGRGQPDDARYQLQATSRNCATARIAPRWWPLELRVFLLWTAVLPDRSVSLRAPQHLRPGGRHRGGGRPRPPAAPAHQRRAGGRVLVGDCARAHRGHDGALRWIAGGVVLPAGDPLHQPDGGPLAFWSPRGAAWPSG